MTWKKMAGKGFCVLPVESTELPVIEQFIFENFTDMPLYEAFGINSQESDAQRITTLVPEQPYFLKAVRPDGTIVGVAQCDEEISFDAEGNTPDEVLKMSDFLKFVVEDSKIYLIPEKTIELGMLSVKPDCRGEGIGKRLIEESVDLARSLGYEVVRILCANAFTERIAKSLGWERFYSLEYEDYGEKSGTNVVVKPAPPHRTISYYIKRL